MTEYVTTPLARVTADLGQGVTTQDVTSWSVRRNLSGTGLPGQVRAVSGSSVGDGTVEVEIPNATPWRGGIAPGGQVYLEASEDVSVPTSPLGRFVAREIDADGALTSRRSVSIEDDLTAMRRQVQIPPAMYVATDQLTSRIDAAWVIDQCARVGGRYQTPPPVASAILSAPMCGNIAPEVGTPITSYVGGQSVRWTTDSQGRICPSDLSLSVAMTQMIDVGESVYVTLSDLQWSTIVLRDSTNASGINFNITGVGEVWCSRAGSASAATTYLGPPTGRVQIQVENTSTTQTRYRARSSATAAWSEWKTVTGTARPSATLDTATLSYGASGVQITLEDDPALWARPTARIAASESPLTAIILSEAREAWALAQEVASSTLGAVWIDEAGDLVYRGPAGLRGRGAIVERIRSLTDLDDVPWEISTDDVADRVEVTYEPPSTTTRSAYTETIWEAGEAIAIPGGQTVTKDIQLEGEAVADVAEFYPVWDTSKPADQYSRWAASPYPNGGNPQNPADDALRITATVINPSLIRLRITNTTKTVLYTVNGNGDITLLLRAKTLITSGESITLSIGKGEDEAVNPLSLSFGPWVQDYTTARELLGWISSQVIQPRPILSGIQVTPKASRHLGDVVIISDPTTGLASKALISGIENSGSAGKYAQSLTLTLLDVTVWDVEQYITANTVQQVDALILNELGADATVGQVETWLERKVLEQNDNT